MSRAQTVLAGLRAAMARAGVSGVDVFDAGSSFRHVDAVVHTAGWRIEGGSAELRARTAAYLVAKERALGLPNPGDGAQVEAVLATSAGETAYGDEYALVLTYKTTRPRCWAKRAA